MAAFHAPTLAIADELGLFAALRDQPSTANELAAAIAIEPRAVESMAGVMAGLGFLVLADGRFSLTETSRTYLLPDSPFYWGGMLRRIRNTPIDCNKLIQGLRQGTAAADARLTAMWQAPKPPPEALVAFTHAMHAHSFSLATRTIDSFGLASARSLLDVAGGSGSYSIAAAARYPELRCTLLDLPVVCEVATTYARASGVRVDLAPADMFADPWPKGHDRILLSDIFHDWDDERCRWLATRAFDALAPGGRLLVHEMLLSDTKDGPLWATSYSMIMVFVTQGRQRSAREITDILEAAGFSAVGVTMTSNGYALLSGTKA